MNKIFLLGANNEQLGPFTAMEVKQGLANGNYRTDQLAFMEGLSDWTPLTDLLALVEKTTAPMPLSSLAYVSPNMVAPENMVYATFGQRFAAWFIDWFIIVFVNVVIIFMIPFLGPILKIPSEVIASSVGAPFFILVILYFIILECSPMQGTIGKWFMGLRVTDETGYRIGFLQSIGRWVGKILSTIILFGGFFMILTNKKKQGLHDIMARTLVIMK